MHGNGSHRAQSLIDNAGKLATSGSRDGGGRPRAQQGKGIIEL